jgi:hypothetical protein
MGILNWFSGSETFWSHHDFELVGGEWGHRSLTFTTMDLNGPLDFGEYGSLVAVILKQRPQASPKLWLAPNASVLTAAEYPFTVPPHAEEDRHAQHRLQEAQNHQKIGAELTGGFAAFIYSEARFALGVLHPASRVIAGVGANWHVICIARLPALVVHDAVWGNGESGEEGEGEDDCEFHWGLDDELGWYKVAASAVSGPTILGWSPLPLYACRRGDILLKEVRVALGLAGHPFFSWATVATVNPNGAARETPDAVAPTTFYYSKGFPNIGTVTEFALVDDPISLVLRDGIVATLACASNLIMV